MEAVLGPSDSRNGNEWYVHHKIVASVTNFSPQIGTHQSVPRLKFGQVSPSPFHVQGQLQEHVSRWFANSLIQTSLFKTKIIKYLL